MLLTLLSGLPVAPTPARAQGQGIINNGTPTISRAQYQANPSLLMADPGMLGPNIRGLQAQGVATAAIQQTLQSSGMNPAQINALTNIMNSPAMASSGASATIDGIMTSIVAGTLPPEFVDAMMDNPLFGAVNSAAELMNMLNDPAIQSAMRLFTNPGGAVDALLALAIGQGFNISNFTPAQLTSLTNQLMGILPSLGTTVGAAALQQGIADVLGMLSTGANPQAIINNLIGVGGPGIPPRRPIRDLVSPPIPRRPPSGNCQCTVCEVQIPLHHYDIRTDITDQFELHRRWLLTVFFLDNILPALQLMAEQLTAAGILQVEIIGTFFDAKHQLESQRIFQTLTARAHKDYHPSEGMCTFGTTVRSLAGSDRRSNLAQVAYAQRMMQRQALSGEAISYQGEDSDRRARLTAFIANYCDQADNANGLNFLCRTAVPDPARRNADVDFTRNIESKLTLDMDFIPVKFKNHAQVTPDERDAFALAANLFSNEVAPRMKPELLGEATGTRRVRQTAAEKYMDQRAIFAKRSVAQNSFAALIAMRTSGDPESAPYTKAIMRELGITDDKEIEELLGLNPSYFAQMEILTKKIYQNPIFYTELYDQPANIERKGAALQAIGLMQDRDLYNSLLRSEAVLSVLLETQLQREQEKVINAMGAMNPAGGSR